MKQETMSRTPPHARDSAVAAALRGARSMPASGDPVLIAFRNEDDEVYRYAVLEGAAQVRYLRQRLVQLELMADVEDSAGVLRVLGCVVQPNLLRA